MTENRERRPCPFCHSTSPENWWWGDNGHGQPEKFYCMGHRERAASYPSVTDEP